MFAEDGARLDVALARVAPMSRSRLQALIRAGRVRLEGEAVDEPARRVKFGERWRLDPPPLAPAEPIAEAIPLDVLFEDASVIVFEKPAGMVTHPAPGHSSGTLVNALLAHCEGRLSGIGGVARPGIVHRLDRDVSGVMMAAKTDAAHRSLAGQLAIREVERVYCAIVWGAPETASGVIDAPIGRHRIDRKRMAVTASGKRAVTRWRRTELAGPLARLELKLETGRTHQIRVHLERLGCPILGDPIYGTRRAAKAPPELAERIARAGRVWLHATSLAFRHPETGERVRFERSPPALFEEILAVARDHGKLGG